MYGKEINDSFFAPKYQLYMSESDHPTGVIVTNSKIVYLGFDFKCIIDFDIDTVED